MNSLNWRVSQKDIISSPGTLYHIVFPANCLKGRSILSSLAVPSQLWCLRAKLPTFILLSESQNLLGLKRPLKFIESNNYYPARPSPPLNHNPKCHIYLSAKYPQAWWLNHFHGQPVPVLEKPLCEEIFLIAHLNLPWHNLKLLFLVLLFVTWEKRPAPASLKPFRLLQRS